MAIKKARISELTLVSSMSGLYALGVKIVNGVQTTVRVSMKHIQDACDNAIEATLNAISATEKANIATNNAKKATDDISQIISEINVPRLEVKTKGNIVFVRHGRVEEGTVIVFLRKTSKSKYRKQGIPRRGGNAYRIYYSEINVPITFKTKNTEDWYPIPGNFCLYLPFVVRNDDETLPQYKITYVGQRINQVNPDGEKSMYAKIGLQLFAPIHGEYNTSFNSYGYKCIGNLVKMKHRVWLDKDIINECVSL